MSIGLNKISNWYFSRHALPYWGILFLDCLIIIFSGFISYYLFSDGNTISNRFWQLLVMFILICIPMLVGMKIFHTYSGIIRYSSFVDLMRVSCSLLVGFAITAISSFVLYGDVLWKVGTFMFVISMIGMWSFRILVKYTFDSSFGHNVPHILIFGVREGGISLAKSIRNEHPIPYLIRGFISADEKDKGRYLVGAKVFMLTDNFEKIIKQEDIKYILVSPLCTEQMQNNSALADLFIKNGVKIMMYSNQGENWDGKSKLTHQSLHQVQIEDLLPRDPIKVDMDKIGEMLRGHRILITGAAGSIGSEMVRQVAKFAPAEMTLIDQAETPMHDIRLYMANNWPNIKCQTIVTSITNESHMQKIFTEHRPEYLFHAAAYKHVPMMEDNPALAIQNNCHGTQVIADLAVKYGTKKFVMISTDKAVNPTNVMGCSKRICEIYCQSLNQAIQNGECPIEIDSSVSGGKAVTQFVTTRFGNVLGSNGSVIPIFREQIKKGGPVTVTHPDIIRYFMLIPEACKLVLEAGTMGNGGEIFVFDMGNPVRIADLAKRMIELSGAKNVEIKYTGLRDGEKLYEEVLNDAESTKPTFNSKIKIAQVRSYDYKDAVVNEERLYNSSFSYNDMQIVKIMKEIVPEYKSRHSKYEALDFA